MEKFEFEDKGKCEMIYVRKWKLAIQVIHIEAIPPNLPDDALIVFGTYLSKAKGGVMGGDMDTVSAFCILNDSQIEYELYLTDNLVETAIQTWCAQMIGKQFDKIDYSPGYHAKYIDSRPTDPKELSPELLAYIMRENPNDGLDFYEWKAKNLATALN